MKILLPLLLVASSGFAQMRVMGLPSKSPLVTFRIVITAGSEADPADKPGLAYLTAMMLADSGTKEMTYQQVTAAMFPMAASVSAQVDKQMCTFSGATHVDNLDAYYKLLRAKLLDPGWRDEDFQRVKDDAINYLKVSLRGNNDEELAKEVLYQTIYQGTTWERYSVGTVSSLEKITLDDLKKFYHAQYAQSNLILGIAGGYTPAFLESMKKDFQALPVKAGFRPRPKALSLIGHSRMVIVDKETRSVAYSIGFPISVTRANPDYPALLLAASYLGQHRMSSGVLYNEMREKRGLNYGDYAYIEYFPRGMFLMEPNPNLARTHQIFQLWIRPVERPTAMFALRMALYELDRLIKDGIPQEGFDHTRAFLTKYVNVLTRNKRSELGYAMDSLFYGTASYDVLIKTALAKVTREDVNRVVRRYLRADKLVIVAVTRDGEALKRDVASSEPSSMTYNSPKSDAIMTEDKIIEKWPLNLKPEDIQVIPATEVFQ